MPVRNGARFIVAAIESVLAQTFRDFELIVVDDASTDGTAAAVASCRDSRIRSIIHDRHHGLPRALNTGLGAATAPYIARLDADDVAHVQRLEKQSAFLDRHPGVALVGSRARRIDATGTVRGVVERPVSTAGIRWLAMLENPFIHSATMFRRAAALEAGGYREDVPYAEDFDLWGRLMAAHDVHNCDELLIDYRDWSESIMSGVDRQGGRSAALRRSLSLLIRRHVERELAIALPESDAQVLAGFTAGIPRQDLSRFLALFDRLCAAFQDKHSEALRSRDYRRTVARAVATIAQRVTPPSRAGAIAVYGHALRRAPRLAGELPWLRAAALFTVGR
jgi:glycosyltransferase involved in cell wall biosynthesis